MNKGPTALIWNAHWETFGGGEKYALELGVALQQDGFCVFFAGTCNFPGEKFKDIFNLDISKLQYLKVSSEGEIYNLASVSDLFVNASYGSRLPAPHLNSIYICHFPFIGRIHRYVNRLVKAHSYVQTRSGKVYADASNSIVIGVDSSLRLGKTTHIRTLESSDSWKLTKESKNDHIQIADLGSDLTTGLYFLERGPGSSSTFAINGLSEPGFFNFLSDFPTRFLFFKDTYKQVWVHSGYVAEWTKKYWARNAFVIYPPVSTARIIEPNRNPFKIISVGRFMSKNAGHSKNQLELVEAFSKLTRESDLPWELHLVGGVSKEQQRYFNKTKVRSENLKITLHPNASYEELTSLYSTSSIYWHAAGLNQRKSHPERFEHFGITVVEAMAQGLIPLVFKVGGPAEILVEYPELTFTSLNELVRNTIALVTREPENIRIQMEEIAITFDSKNFHSNALEKIYTLANFKKSINDQ